MYFILFFKAYVKFSGAPVSIHKHSNPFSSHLPSLVCSEGALTKFPTVTAFLRKQNYSCDYELSPKQCSEVLAYENLLKAKLYPVLMYLWWVEPKSYYDVIHTWFFKNIPFPYKFWYPGKYHKEKVAFVSSLYSETDDDQIVETELHKQAQECLTMLSNKLGEKEYFFGRSPTTIDAIIFSYLLLLLKVDLKVCVLQNHIKACPNLSRYVTKILQRYFPSETKASHDTIIPIDDVPNKGRNLVISVLFAFTAMFGYAVASGLVQVDMGDNLNDTTTEDYNYEDDYDEYEDESQDP
ncbi:Metaxin-1 [Armadillidium nasatum]|uniref:Metaxin-1 n=1 Tax=Armadillidium nasatum TaxID=96803 RepID=A0A5N5SQ23_9CRUS|nr:Metaxin-1 [Armadillidium nasatum]